MIANLAEISDRGSAVLSTCGRYRFELRRAWGYGPRWCWVMLNPSTADHKQDDPTIRRCIDFTRRHGGGSLVVVNLIPLRSSKPRDALRWYSQPPIGGEYFENLGYIDNAAKNARVVVAAWGSWGALDMHGDTMRESLNEICEPVCLGRTKSDQPRHPLYVAKDTLLERFE